jgi:hypothetical protein
MGEPRRLDWWINWWSWLFGFAIDKHEGLALAFGPLSVVFNWNVRPAYIEYREGDDAPGS